MFLLDTNVLSELRKADGGRADTHVVAWAADKPVATLFVSAITLLELDLGILLIERRDAAQGAILRDWLEQRVLPAFVGRILTFDAAAARRCAPMHVPDPRPDRDTIIAAIALTHGLTVATRNVADFAGTGVAMVNPCGS